MISKKTNVNNFFSLITKECNHFNTFAFEKTFFIKL